MTVALIVAAGSGQRLGAGRPKALVELGGRPLVAWSIDALLATAGIERIVIAMPPGAAASLHLGAEHRITVVDGGVSRSDSVRCALDAAKQRKKGGGGRARVMTSSCSSTTLPARCSRPRSPRP